jgi:hypothetical protein
MKTLQIYDFSMAAGGSFVLPVSGNYFRIITTTGNVNVVADTWGKLGPISRGQGLENSLYNRLTIQDASGAPNSGTILVSDANFIDQTLYGSISLAGAVSLDSATLLALEQVNVRPEAQTGTFKSNSVIAANTPETVFTAGANSNGAIILTCGFTVLLSAVSVIGAAFLSKATAPTTSVDGDLILSAQSNGYGANSWGYEAGQLQKEQFISAGVGLYFISTAGCAVNSLRHCRYKML